MKTFSCRIVNDPEALAEEEKGYKGLPIVRKITQEMLLENFLSVRHDILALINAEMKRIENTPGLKHLVIK